MVEIVVIKDHEKHSHPGHPERPERVDWIVERIGYTYVWDKIDKDIVLKVHDPKYVEMIRNHVGWLDPDTYVTSHTFEVAVRAATASYYTEEGSFVLTRPPGHHALKDRGMGFCIFNNAVIASLRDEKVGILDVDAHHGNGTEEMLPDNAVYASIHMGVGYPGTGKESDERRFNVPVYHPLTDQEFVRFLNKVFRFFGKNGVEFVVVSLGFDGLYTDPLSYFNLTPEVFYELGKRLRDWSWKAVLEGGYSRKIGEAAERFIEGVSFS